MSILASFSCTFLMLRYVAGVIFAQTWFHYLIYHIIFTFGDESVCQSMNAEVYGVFKMTKSFSLQQLLQKPYTFRSCCVSVVYQSPSAQYYTHVQAVCHFCS